MLSKDVRTRLKFGQGEVSGVVGATEANGVEYRYLQVGRNGFRITLQQMLDLHNVLDEMFEEMEPYEK